MSQIKRRIRAWEHARHCKKRQCENAALSPFETAFEVLDGIGVVPDTRCGVCTYERLAALADADGKGSEYSPMFRAPISTAKFSWQKGAKPMARNVDGTYDGSGWFREKPVTPEALGRYYKQWGREIDRRRSIMDPSLPRLPVELFRPHSDRHGAVLNFKRAGWTADKGAPHVCMSEYMWHNVYGLQDAITIGEELTPGVVRPRRRAGDA